MFCENVRFIVKLGFVSLDPGLRDLRGLIRHMLEEIINKLDGDVQEMKKDALLLFREDKQN
ncbi:MAG: hypothetical protein CSA45_04735 [Gammaproteobacteria bacterium]|nr:MAG: hypothetical protein CSA45_04735 [Gammaproteobacteria bacterium]